MTFAFLQHYVIPDKIVSAIRVIYDQSTCQVYIQGQQSKPFAITTGVLQGDVLALFLFIIVPPKDLLEIMAISLTKGSTRKVVEEQFVALHAYPTTK